MVTRWLQARRCESGPARDTRQARRRLLQEHAERRAPVRALARPRQTNRRKSSQAHRCVEWGRTAEGGIPAADRSSVSRNHIKLFNGVLSRAKLKFDRDGNRRTAYSVRHPVCALWKALTFIR